MERRKFTREFKLEAVRLIKDRGVSYVQASQDLSVHPSQLRDWVKKFADDAQHAFPGHGQMTAQGWLYVAAVVDLFSRRVVGWSMSAAMTAQLNPLFHRRELIVVSVPLLYPTNYSLACSHVFRILLQHLPLHVLR